MKIRFILALLVGLILCTSPSSATNEAREAFQQGYILLSAKEYYPAINNFKLVINDPSYPLLDYTYFFIAEAYLDSHNPEEAKQVYTIVLNYYKESILLPRTWFGLAQAHILAKENEAATTTLYELISRFPNDELIPEARFLLGKTLEAQGKITEAARVYRNIDLLHSGSDYADKALERLDQLARQATVAGYEAPAATIYNLGVKHFKNGNYTKATEYFTRLTKSYSKSTLNDEANLMLGRIYLRQGKLPSAEKYLVRAAKLNKDSRPEALFYLALTYGYQASPRAAIAQLAEVATNYPNSPVADEALYYIGQYCKGLGEEENALAAWEKLATDYPNSDFLPDSLWYIGNYYYKQGKYAEAYNIFAKTFTLSPEKASDRLTFWAGKCAERQGQHNQAVSAYKMTVTRYDHSYYAYRAREELRKFNINLAASAIPDVPEVVAGLDGGTRDTLSHEEKYRELIAIGLDEDAAEEAGFLAEKLPPAKKEKANIAKYHAYVSKGKFIKPISFADRKIEEKMLAGTLSQIDPNVWRLAYPRGYWSYVEKYAPMYSVDPALVYAVIREESRFKSQAISHASARGLMQIMPGTGRLIMKDLGLSYSRSKLYQPETNIQLGSYYLAEMIKRFDGNVSLALAGYNGGPNRVSKWLKKYANFDIDEFVEEIPLSETRNYVKKVMKSYYGYKRTYGG